MSSQELLQCISFRLCQCTLLSMIFAPTFWSIHHYGDFEACLGEKIIPSDTLNETLLKRTGQASEDNNQNSGVLENISFGFLSFCSFLHRQCIKIFKKIKHSFL